MMPNLILVSELQHRIASQNDEAAFKELFLQYFKQLKLFASSILHDSVIAEDIVVTVFERIWEKRKTLDLVANFHLYVYVAVRNQSLNYLRKERKVEIIGLDGLEFQVSGYNSNSTSNYDTKLLEQQIRLEIDKLPERCKLIFYLVKDAKLKQKEVAELLNISKKTVENQLSIAIKRILKSISCGQLEGIV